VWWRVERAERQMMTSGDGSDDVYDKAHLTVTTHNIRRAFTEED
jgi:hypothetical protein